MESSMHIKTKVLPGKRIEFTSSDLVEGEQVEVIIVFPSKDRDKQRSVLDIIDTSMPPHAFDTAESVDKYIEEERNSWNR